MRIVPQRVCVLWASAALAVGAAVSGLAHAQVVTQTQDVQYQSPSNPNVQSYTVEIESVEIDTSTGQEAPITFTTTLKVPPGSTPPDLPQGGAVSNTPLLVSNAPDDPRIHLPPKYGSYGPKGESFARCGGATNGKLDPPCEDTPATFTREANFAKCPDGAFFDLFTKSCYDCPPNYTRSAYGVTSDKACWKRNRAVTSQYSPAKFIRSVCPAGSFSDPKRGGECWSCPQGFFRGIAPVGSELACVQWRHQDLVPARQTAEGEIPELRCKVGEFVDTELGGCFACPVGYQFTGAPRDGEMACSKTVPTQRAPATLQGVAKCEPGEFLSPRNLGECWVCPPNMQRSGLPLTGEKACQSIGGFNFKHAEYIDSRVCPAGEKHSPWGIGHKPIRDRIRTQTGRNPPSPNLADNKLPGTCWTCPTGYKRKAATMVWSDKACESIGIGWSPAPYQHPGLFGLDGAEEVAREIIRNRPGDINKIASGMSRAMNLSPAQAQRDAWDEIAGAPHESMTLQIAVWSRVVLAAEDPEGATAAEKKLVESFQTATQRYREHVAQIALDLGREWTQVESAENTQKYAEAGPGGAYGTGGDITKIYENPPDFDQLSAEVAVATFVGGGALWIGGLSLLANASETSAEEFILPYREQDNKTGQFPDPAAKNLKNKLRKQITSELLVEAGLDKLPRSGVVRGQDVEKIIDREISNRFALERKAAEEAGEEFGKKFAKSFGKKLASSLSRITAWVSGPFVELILEVVVNAIEQAIKKANIIPQLEAKLAQMRQPVSVARWLNTSEGIREAMGHWSSAMGGTTPPRTPDVFASVAKAELAKVVDGPAADPNPAFTLVSLRDQSCAFGRDKGVVPGSCDKQPTLWRSVGFRLLPQPQGDAPVCAALAGTDLVLRPCDLAKPVPPEEMWNLDKGLIVSAKGPCWQHAGDKVRAQPCSPTNPMQKWDARVQ